MTSTPVSDHHHGDRRRRTSMPVIAEVPVGADPLDTSVSTATTVDGATPPVPVAEGIAPTRGEAAGMDWSGSRKAAAVGALLEASTRVDRARLDQLEALVRVIGDGAAEEVVGLPVEVVLAQSGRCTRRETGRLLKVARVIARMPAVRHAFQTGQVSWSQVDAITWTMADLPVGRWAEVDAVVVDAALSRVDVEADSLVTDVEWAAARIAGELWEERKRTPVEDNRLVLQPRLDGSGDLHGSFDATHFPVLADRIDQAARGLEAVPDPSALAASAAGSVADGAVPATASVDGTAADGSVADGDGDGDVGLMGAGLTEAHRHAAAMAGRNAARRAAALFGLVVGWDADTLQPLPDGDTRRGGGGGGGGSAGRPSVIVTTDLDALLTGTTPAWLLNRLMGRMHVTADVARRWVDVHGADVRLVVMDDGQPVGVGHRTNVPPGWLTDAVIARDLHDTAPVSTTPALLCDVEHTVPWNHADPSAGGTTDVANLALVSRRWHTRKTRGQLHLDRHEDGSATWTVIRMGYQVHTAPPPHLARRAPLRPAGWRRLDDIPSPDHPDPEGPDPGGSDRHGLGRPAGARSHDRAPP